MSMTSHPLAFGTIEHTEKAGELLGDLVREVRMLREMLSVAVRQNEHDMLMTGEELRACRAALGA